jgi:hypothetical protein
MLGTCRLCLERRDLKESHLLPAGVHKLLREPAAPNPNHILLTPQIAFQTSRPIKDYLLCAHCEDLFSRNGQTLGHT